MHATKRAHVVNFGKDEGFAIMSGDNRASQLYAISDEGSFAPADTATNPGMRIFMANAEQYFENEIQAYGGYFPPETEIDDPSWENPLDKIEIVNTPFAPYSEIGNIINLQWGQGKPYNDVIFSRYGARYPTCCVATAVATVMAYHEYPASFNGFRYDWKEMKKYTSSHLYEGSQPCASNSATVHNMIANLMYTLGIGGYLSVDYYMDGSSADITNMPRTFIDFGYSHGSSHESYNLEVLKESLRQNSPVLVSGYTDKTYFLGIPIYDNGHTWVVDKYLKMRSDKYHRVKATGEMIYINSSYIDLVHCNWGWDGNSNGYFYSGIFNIHKRVIADGNTSDAFTDPHYYLYKVEMLPFVRK